MRTWTAFLLLTFIACLFCSKQECKADSDKDISNRSISAEVPRKDAVPSADGKQPNPETSDNKQNRSNGQAPQANWCKLFAAALINNSVLSKIIASPVRRHCRERL
jgi:hypothetical protein